MVITTQTVITAAALLAAVIAILKQYNKVYDMVKHQADQDRDIKKIKQEQTLMVYSMRACLDGLQQLNCNGPVTDAKTKLDKYINQQAHDQLEV